MNYKLFITWIYEKCPEYRPIIYNALVDWLVASNLQWFESLNENQREEVIKCGYTELDGTEHTLDIGLNQKSIQELMTLTETIFLDDTFLGFIQLNPLELTTLIGKWQKKSSFSE